MSNTPNPATQPEQLPVYHIRIRGHLGPEWSTWFEGLTVTLEENGDTLLTGPVVDQAALHGLIRKIRDLGLPLVSVMEVDSEQAKGPDLNRSTIASCRTSE